MKCRTISTLAGMQLGDLQQSIQRALDNRDALDPYTRAHLTDASKRISKALEAQYVMPTRASF